MRGLTSALRGAFANLRSGARLALFAPVQRPDFHVDAAQLLLFFVVSALVDNAADWVRAGPGSTLEWAALGAELTSFAILVTAAALLAWLFADVALIVALPIIVLASLPLVQIANLGTHFLEMREDLPFWLSAMVYYLLLAWFLAVLWRSAFVAMQPGPRRSVRALAGGLLLAIPLFLPDDVLPNTSWWQQDDQPGASLDATNPASEPVLALQRELQDEALGALEDQRQGETDLYFVAFAPDGGPAWGSQLSRAKRTMDEHWRTQQRSLAFVNDRATLTEVPMATVSHLREALEEIGSAIDMDEDVVMLYVAGRSNDDGSLRASMPPLALVPLTAAGLSHLLTQAGIRWRIIVVATCDLQPFIDALVDDQTLLIATSASSAECSDNRTLAALGEALFGEALPLSTPIPAAIESVRRSLERRGVRLSVHMGAAIAPKLTRLRKSAGANATAPIDAPRG
jgi:hypothetical protein